MSNFETKVLVVGGAGYIGGCVVDSLMMSDIPFTVYDNLTYEERYLKPVDFIYGDVRDREKLKKILPLFTHVVWLAALVGDGACAINSEVTKEINQDAVGWLVENFDGRIIFTSTCSVYGANEKPVIESSELNPLSVYAQTKREAEKHLQNKNALIFRLGTAYGIGDTYSRIRMDLAINYMTSLAVRKKEITVFGGKQWRPFIHVKDIGEIIVQSLDKPHMGIYNLAAENLTMISAGEKIRDEVGCKLLVTKEKFQDERNYNANTSKALDANILQPKIVRRLSSGINEVKDIALSRRINDFDNDVYSNHKFLLNAMEGYKKWK
jgi:nucleoside-diphosphate-sugar epimerase